MCRPTMTDLALGDRRVDPKDVKSYTAGYMFSVVIFAILGTSGFAHGLWKLWTGDFLNLYMVAGALVTAAAIGAYGVYTILSRRWCYLDVTLTTGREFRVRGGKRDILAHVARLKEAGVSAE
ncbi:MAG: hypothetical protein EA355_11840 [Rhodobacteraceae bacterium]|nr:MAG: hypothetical protein EA355_11840 [Paracoccaceae bacterium]